MALDITKIHMVIEGLSDIMFDRFIDHSKEKRPADQKLYLAEGNKVVLPAENLYAFLFSENPPGCAKSLEGKAGKQYISMGQGHLTIEPLLIPFKRGTTEIVYKSLKDTYFSIFSAAPRTKQGSLSIKQELKDRPILKMPWQLEFEINLLKNNKIDEVKLRNWFDAGGITIALGTYRPRFGRFWVKDFKVK